MAALEAPSAFEAFPYAAPYAIQIALMRAVYEAIETRKVAVLESPTGTGKSLSLLCSAVQWLLDNARRPAAPAADAGNGDDPDWMRAFVPKDDGATPTVALLPPPLGPPPPAPSLPERSMKRARVETAAGDDDGAAGDDEEFLLDEVDEDNSSSLNSAVLAADEDDAPHVQKIYYCSRTHSQLAQFLGELKRTRFAAEIAVVSLGSRKNLCVNDSVNKLNRSATRVNEICVDMQTKSATSKHRCPYIDKTRQPPLVYALRTAPADVEEAAALGRRHGSCPYYATRASVPVAQLVTLPYQMLLHRRTRESLGIKLDEQVVVIDEAHNLIDTVAELYSATLTLPQADEALTHLRRYIQRYRARLLSANLVSLKMLERLLGAFVTRMQARAKAAPGSSGDQVVTLADFWTGFSSNVDTINLFKMCRFLDESKLARKLHGFVEHADGRGVAMHTGADEHDGVRPTSPMHAVEAFLTALTNSDQDGRVMIQGDLMRFILLNPARAFEDVVSRARAVLLLGGTMKPLSEFRNLLFPKVPSDRFTAFECGHVVPPTSVMCLAVDAGPSGHGLELVLERRGDVRLMDEVGESLVQLAQRIPDGLIVFFQKFDYVEQLCERWRATGLYGRLQAVKHIYVEPRTTAAVESTLAAYAESIETARGAMLLCVVNGKMSEGINFKDRMGRGVVVVGLPYANRFASALRAKIDFLNWLRPQQGDEYYENLCMKAVNQSIGRAIRHRDDYAVIVLLDRRFSHKRARLPGWIAESFAAGVPFADVLARIDGFFARRAS